MGKHSSRKTSYLELAGAAVTFAREQGCSGTQARAGELDVVVAFFTVGILAGGTIGLLREADRKLSAEVYLAFKQGQWQQRVPEEEVAKSLTALSTDPPRASIPL